MQGFKFLIFLHRENIETSFMLFATSQHAQICNIRVVMVKMVVMSEVVVMVMLKEVVVIINSRQLL